MGILTKYAPIHCIKPSLCCCRNKLLSILSEITLKSREIQRVCLKALDFVFPMGKMVHQGRWSAKSETPPKIHRLDMYDNNSWCGRGNALISVFVCCSFMSH